MTTIKNLSRSSRLRKKVLRLGVSVIADEQ